MGGIDIMSYTSAIKTILEVGGVLSNTKLG